MGGEDLDLLIRLILDGHAVRYEPRALLWHDHPATMERLTTQVRSYGVGLAAMAAKHLVDGDERAYLLRQAPSVFRYLLSPASRKNEQKGPEFPRELVVRERLGMVEGPLALVRSRRDAKRADAASAAFRPTWIGQGDLADGVGDVVAPARVGEPYRVARLLVRNAGEPLGFVEIDLDDEQRADTDAVRAAIDAELAEAVASPPAHESGPHPVGTPSVTVVVSTRDREDSLRAALRSLLAVDYPDFDVIVVDNAPRPTTAPTSSSASPIRACG